MMSMFKRLMSAAALVLLAGAAWAGDETVRLADGGKLVLTKQALQLFDAGGKARASLPMRAEQLDVRGTLAVVRDSASAHVLALRVDGATLQALPPLPLQSFGAEAICLFRDQQGLEQLFIVGRDGQAEQWLMQGAPRLVRRLALPPGVEHCRVDDARQHLLVSEAGVGTWAYDANSEAPPRRKLRKGASPLPATLPVLIPRAQTEPVARMGDVADDPAIWVHPVDPARSRVLGTNKKQGLMVYDLQGKQVQFLASGRLNNVDLRQRVALGGQLFDLALASQRDDNSLVVYGIGSEGQVDELARIPSGLDEVYGICLYQPAAGGLDAIVNDKDGRFRQFSLALGGGLIKGKLVREFRVASQPEGCVADDRRGRLFIGEEKRGVWTLAADGGARPLLRQVLGVGRQLHADVEGMAIYQGAQAAYLVVSSQGDNSYVVLDALPPFAVRGKFRIGFNVEAGIDGASETDGLDVTSRHLGAAYPQGMLVVQDGYKRLPDGTQNFKYVAWDEVARALKLLD
jgi:3-phytase